MEPLAASDLSALAARIADQARGAGADVAEVSVDSGWQLSARVRLGKLELLEEAGTRSVALRVIRDQRVSVTSTSDLSTTGIDRCVSDALMLAELSEPDELAGPAEVAELCGPPHPDLSLYDDAVASLPADDAIEWARAAEQAALQADPRLTLSEGATFSRSATRSTLVLSSGFSGTVQGTRAWLEVNPVAEDGGGKRRQGSYFTAHRHLAELESADAVGREAARRTLAKLGARRVDTCEAAVVFEPDAARSILGAFAECVLGGAIWRQASYLVGREGDRVAADGITIVDDPLLAAGPRSRPFDGEGLRSRRNVVVDGGVLRGYLLDSYAARKLGRASTANAARAGGAIAAATSNFFVVAGTRSAEDIIASTPRGLYVTDMMGFGFNPLTGDFSRGASGFWIESGELAFPVSEVTISSNLDSMFRAVDAVGADLQHRTGLTAPTFRVASMTVAGT